MADIFLSYNREDRARALMVADSLTQEGLSVWWDSDLRAGENYDEVTENNLRGAGVVVVLWSKRSVQSKWVRAEATIGQRKSALMPAMIEDCDRPLLFELIQTADLIKWQGDRADPEWRHFVDHIKMRVKANAAANAPAPEISPAPAPPPPPPRPVQPQQPQSARADAEKARQIEAATALHAATVETTFWQSIKDGSNASEYEDYLARYPNGHFAAIARNRIAMICAPKPAPRPVAPPPPPPRPQPEMKKPAPQRPAAPVNIVERRKAGGALPMVLGLLLVLILGGGAAYYFLVMAPHSSTNTASEPPTPPAAPAKATSLTSLRGSQADAPVASDTKAPEKLVVAAADSTPSPTGETAAPVQAAAAPTPSAPPAEAPSPVKAANGFQDCPNCPQMVPLKAGIFLMGSPPEEPGHYAYESPQHQVTVAAFAVGATEVTFDQWAACVADHGCGGMTPRDQGWGRGKRPVIGISWEDAESYVAWLSQKTGHKYRLPSEAEWEYAARAGATTAYPWGAAFGSGHVPTGQTHEVGSYAPNAFGLYDMIGNAAEWVEDCYVSNYKGAPTDGHAWLDGECRLRVIRGGYYHSSPSDLRLANRGRIERTNRAAYLSFRVATSPRN